MYSVLLNSTSELGSTFTTVVSMSFFSHTCWCNWVQSAVRFLLISAGVAMICQDIFLGILCDAEIWLLNRCRILSSVTFVCYSHTMTMASVFHALSCCAQKYTSLLGQSLVVGLLGNWFEKKNPHLKANENCSHFGRSPTYCPTHLRWLGIYLHLQSDHFFQWLGAEILLPRFYAFVVPKKIMEKMVRHSSFLFFGQEAMQHQRGKANGGIACGEFLLVWVHWHRKSKMSRGCGCLMWFLLGMWHTPKDLQNTRCTKFVDGCLLIQTASQWQGPVLLNASSKNACYTTELNITPEKWWSKDNPFPLGPSNFSGSNC